jgi:hypothetical protein
MIEKPTIIITSLGRTGTRFFAAMLGEVLPNVTSLHEPDVFQIVVHGQKRISRSLTRIQKQINQVGLYNLLIRKAMGQWSLIRLSDARIQGALEYNDAVKYVKKQRSRFIHHQAGSVYAESNAGYYAVIDVLPEIFVHHRVAYIIRDGRSWVRSKMNWGEMYGKGKLRNVFAHTWPTAPEIADDPYADQWHTMSRFERICWAWTRLNGYALGIIQENPNARVFHFEDIFNSDNRYKHLTELVNFTTDIPAIDSIPAKALDGWLDRKVHKSSGAFPAWEEWTRDQQETFVSMCGPMMKQLGYRIR